MEDRGRGISSSFSVQGMTGIPKKGLKVDLLLSLFWGEGKEAGCYCTKKWNGGGGGGGCMFNSGRWLSFEGCEGGRPF